jgi:hypothetical protein
MVVHNPATVHLLTHPPYHPPSFPHAQDLSPSTPVLSVPVSSTLQDTRAPEPYPGAPWNVCLAAQLLQERAKGASSSYWPYLATLPSSCCSPLLLPQHQLSEVQYAPAVAAIAAFQEKAREAFDRIQQQQQQLVWQDWAWALHMVQSRSIRLAQMGCKVMIPGPAESAGVDLHPPVFPCA